MKNSNGNKKEARIFYSKTPHPTQDEYWNKKSLEVHFGDEQNEQREIEIKKSFFNEHWVELPLKMEIDDESESSFEKIFAIFNDYNLNPLSHQNGGQDIVKKLKTHTSMSVEDIIEVNGNFYITVGQGFKKIIWEE
jgi:hypothetical protein